MEAARPSTSIVDRLKAGGYLIYAAAGALRAVRFDPVRLEVLGDPVTVVEHVMMKPSGAANYAVSRPGTLVYMTPGASVPDDAAVARVGRPEGTRGTDQGAAARLFGRHALSPDGTRVAVVINDQESADIWIWDFARETLRRLTFDPGGDGMPVWTPDGRRIIFMSNRAGVPNLYAQAADGTGDRRPADDEREPAVADVDHAGREACGRLRAAAQDNRRCHRLSADESCEPTSGRCQRRLRSKH